ncbi:MAG: hypothetical protein M1292_11385 [Bacteroidetes bacterium]|nr:hypothetical protein [Bacteroidota bacterium]
MSSQNIKLESSKLTAELCYSAFLRLTDVEKETFINRLLNSLNSKAAVITSTGKLLSKKQYIAHIESISNEVKEGKFISHDDILENME